jgi:hypothetical protein
VRSGGTARDRTGEEALRRHGAATLNWPDAVDEILDGDHTVALGYVTPAGGVVLNPLTNTSIRDRERGTLQPVTTSIGLWAKLAAIKRNPQVAIAYHTRSLGMSDRPEYVLVQGTASYPALDDRGWLDRHPAVQRFYGQSDAGALWNRWLAVYHWRIPIDIDVHRITVWPDLACEGAPEIHGAPVPAAPSAQPPPAKGTGPRVNHRRAAQRARNLPDVLLGWTGSAGFPVIAPVRVGDASDRGIALDLPSGIPIPADGRRAGLLAHSFAFQAVGQNQRKYTGWVEVDPAAHRAVYAPHTEAGYVLPASPFLFKTAAGLVTRRGLRAGRRAGFIQV